MGTGIDDKTPAMVGKSLIEKIGIKKSKKEAK